MNTQGVEPKIVRVVGWLKKETKVFRVQYGSDPKAYPCSLKDVYFIEPV